MNWTKASIVIAVLIVAGTIFFVSRGNSTAGNGSTPGTNNAQASRDNVRIENGRQIIELAAKGGYSPRRTIAKAGIPTVVRVSTKGTFDCSSIIAFPSLGITRNLPRTGTEEVDIGTPKPGLFAGSCGMGMYPFEITFES